MKRSKEEKNPKTQRHKEAKSKKKLEIEKFKFTKYQTLKIKSVSLKL